MSIEAMKQALEALEEAVNYTSSPTWSPSLTEECNDAITALRTAIEEAEQERSSVKQEPVGTYEEIYKSMQALLKSGLQRHQQIYAAMKDKPLYTTPPGGRQSEELRSEEDCLSNVATPLAAQREWLGLTDEDKRLFSSWLDDKEDDEVFEAIEQRLKEKNHHG